MTTVHFAVHGRYNINQEWDELKRISKWEAEIFRRNNGKETENGGKWNGVKKTYYLKRHWN